MKISHCRFVCGLILFAVGFAVAVPTTLHASQVISLNIAQQTKAPLIFTGTCIGKESYVMHHPRFKQGLPVTAYTFAIAPDGVIKGSAPERFTFTQLGTPRSDAKRLGKFYVAGMPQYEVGKDYTLFLTRESPLGLRAPLGLDGGKYNILTGPGAQRMVVNSLGNRGMFAGLPATAGVAKALKAGGISRENPPPGPVDYNSFVNVIKGLTK